MYKYYIFFRKLWNNHTWKTKTLVFFLITLFFLLIFWKLSTTPTKFPERIILEIKSGDTLDDVAVNLKEHNIIRSKFVFRSIVLILGRERGVMRGFYLFDKKTNVFGVTQRLIHGDYNLESVRVTIPEGVDRFTMANLFETKILGFNRNEFLEKTKDKEGFLFPDTYIFLPHTSTESVIKTLSENYEKKIAPLRDEMADFGKSEKEIITMASILELEARQFDTRKIIAGILWRRIKIGMPLQVDVSFLVINGKATPSLTLDDLKIDSPYNSYKYKGLPPTPLVNPGLESIKAAFTPTKSSYLYFLSDNEGVMRYASTFEEHIQNKRKYLR